MASDDDMKWLREQITALRADVSQNTATLARNTVSLEHHIRRTDLLETSVDKLRTEFKPVALHVAIVGAVGKGIGIIGTIVGIGAGLARIFGAL